MNQLAINKRTTNLNPGCADLMTMAEQELTAFFRTVTELFGSEQAELATQDWLQELVAAECLPSSTRGWRQITLKASTQLAARVNASSYQVHPKHTYGVSEYVHS